MRRNGSIHDRNGSRPPQWFTPTIRSAVPPERRQREASAMGAKCGRGVDEAGGRTGGKSAMQRRDAPTTWRGQHEIVRLRAAGKSAARGWRARLRQCVAGSSPGISRCCGAWRRASGARPIGRPSLKNHLAQSKEASAFSCAGSSLFKLPDAHNKPLGAIPSHYHRILKRPVQEYVRQTVDSDRETANIGPALREGCCVTSIRLQQKDIARGRVGRAAKIFFIARLAGRIQL